MRTRRYLAAVLIVALTLSALAALALGPASQPAAAQEPGQFATCAELDGVFGFAGNVVVAIKDARSRTASTNPPDVADAFDTLQRYEEVAADSEGAVSLAESVNARNILSDYFGSLCADIGGFGTAIALTCSAYQIAVNTGGETAVLAIKDLRGYAEPGAFNPMNGLDVLQDAESEIPPSGSRPSPDEVEAAYDAVNAYFGQRCEGIDLCFWVRSAVHTGPGAPEAADILRGLQTPGPPGIDAALALISGAISESPFHDSVAEARQQVDDYFACPVLTGTPLLPVTGPPSARPLAIFGSALIAAGALAMATHRRLKAC